MAEEANPVSYEDLDAIEDEFQDIDTQICQCCPLTRVKEDEN